MDQYYLKTIALVSEQTYLRYANYRTNAKTSIRSFLVMPTRIFRSQHQILEIKIYCYHWKYNFKETRVSKTKLDIYIHKT